MVLDVSGVGGAAREVEDRVFVAVPEEVEHGKSTVRWALENLAKYGTTRFVIVHVHLTAPQMVATMGEEDMADPQRVNDQKKNLRAEAEAKLDEYVIMCREQKVCCEKLIAEKGDVAEGLQDLIIHQGITKLVMGAAADESYSEKMKALDSKKAIRLMTAAAPSCKIWFTCKGNLICTREANTTVPAIPSSCDDLSMNDGAVSASIPAIQHRRGEHHYDDNFLSHYQQVQERELSDQRKLEDLKEQNENMAYLIKHFKAKLETEKCLHEKTQQQLYAAVTEAEGLRQRNEHKISTTLPAETLNTEFSYSELEEATQGFNDSLKIGEGIYKGFLRNTTVAIKVLGRKSMQGQSVYSTKRLQPSVECGIQTLLH